MKNKIKMIFPLCFLCLCLYGNFNVVSAHSIITDEAYTSQLQPRKDALVWKTKVVDNVLYRRLYNISKQRWETPWIKA